MNIVIISKFFKKKNAKIEIFLEFLGGKGIINI